MSLLEKSQNCAQLKKKITEYINPIGLSYIQSKRKRTFDIIGAGILVPLALPLIGLASLAIRLEDGGPVLNKLGVLGENKQKFNMFKLRSMKLSVTNNGNNESENGLFKKEENDPRITMVGRLIRKLSVDELPQLLNILKGEMSLVGPRPVFAETMEHFATLPELVDIYSEWANLYNKTKKGCVGPKLVIGRAELTHSVEGLRKGMAAEIEYIKRATLFKDMVWIFRGAVAAASMKGAC